MENKPDPTPPSESPKKPDAAKERNAPQPLSGGERPPQGPEQANASDSNDAGEPDRDRRQKRHTPGAQFNPEAFYQQINNFPPFRESEKNPLANLTMELPTLRPNVRPFQDPKHKDLVKALGSDRILLLASYREIAGCAAAYTVVNDPAFGEIKKRILFPTQQDVELNLLSLSSEALLGKEPQILLVEIEKECELLKATLEAPVGVMNRAYSRLENQQSYVVFSVKEDLIERDFEQTNDLKPYIVSHLCYLLSGRYGEQAQTFEEHLREALGLGPTARSAELHRYYDEIADHLQRNTFEAFLEQLNERRTQPPAPQPERPRRSATFPHRSEIHRAATFIGSYFPGVTQRDFDQLERLLLGDASTTKENVRQAFRRDGKLVTTREKVTESCADRWLREPDDVFRKCSLRTIAAENGTLFVDFREPQLREEMRANIESYHSWYLRRQCDALRQKDVLFDSELSQAAVDGLVQLFIGRTIGEPAGYGSQWLEHLAIRAYDDGENPLKSGDAVARLTLLIREMLDREGLHRVVSELCNRLLAGKEHEALLAILLALVPRLRAGSTFAPLAWMRRLLDEGNDEARAWTTWGLITVARRSGMKIYDYLRTIRTWLPEAGRPAESFTPANCVALDFLFFYNAELMDGSQLWASIYPLFYTLPAERGLARAEIGWLMEWLLDERGAALMPRDETAPLKSAFDLRIGLIADLVEQWAWMLDGVIVEGSEEDRKLFAIVIEELNARISSRARVSLQRAWQQRQDEQLQFAAKLSGADRKAVISRKTKLEDLRSRLSSLPRTPEESRTGGLL